ncbi:S41 family peptidase [Pseudoalteromonas aurantia]|uniref:Peptidase n=1 Tax=Pseudoalteromonas aurantia 208 TaxID=1314867 RepID=A0ABR9E6E4_9GAMM|nr:S41 family peptidase [Pseudoalteromonas aurantia]MBE0366553.1 hypothetical protein [Pseudoalteromonas aurantia 208]
MNFHSCAIFSAGLSLSLMLLTGCGGSGGSTADSPAQNSTTPNSATPPDATWQFGQFTAAENFINHCSNPRTGIDPYENQPFPDQAGSIQHEKMWLRSLTHSTYLWYDEVEDNDPKNFDSVSQYFDSLKTFQTTPSGNQKDQFHFTQTYDAYKKESQSGVSSGYGLRWAAISTKPPRIYRVAYMQDNSPAALAGFKRGDTIVAINNIDINSNNTEALINGLSPTNGSTHTFTISRSGQTESIDIAVTAGDIALSPVQNAKTFTAGEKTVGYVQFNQFISAGQAGLISAFNQFNNANVNALVLDMRYNGGGLVDMAAQLGYMVAGASNSTFSQTIHNDKQSAKNRSVGFERRMINWDTLQYTDTTLPSLNLDTVYILSTASTCSASELIINGLRGIDVNVVLIGSKTCGKPYGFTPAPNCGQVYYTVQFKSANAKGFGDYADGFTPIDSDLGATELGLTANVSGCTVADDFTQPLGNPNEAQLQAALTHIETGGCPVSLVNRPIQQSTASNHNKGVSLTLPNAIWQNNTIYTIINEQK